MIASNDTITITKKEQYRLLGVQEYWIIDPEFQTLTQILFLDNQISEEQTFSQESLSPTLPAL